MFFRSGESMLRKRLALWALSGVLACCMYAKAYAAPVYICVGLCVPIIITDPNLPSPKKGNLVNILNVPVDGVLYDVAFVDGKFNDIFGATAPVLQFTTADLALKASQALSAVLVDVGLEPYGSDPSLTRGCLNDQACVIMTPFELALGDAAFRFIAFVNDNPFLPQVPGDSILGAPTGLLGARSQDFSLGGAFDDTTFAVWRVAGGAPDDSLARFFTPPLFGAPASVQEPNILGLLGVAFVFSLWQRYRRARSAL